MFRCSQRLVGHPCMGLAACAILTHHLRSRTPGHPWCPRRGCPALQGSYSPEGTALRQKGCRRSERRLGRIQGRACPLRMSLAGFLRLPLDMDHRLWARTNPNIIWASSVPMRYSGRNPRKTTGSMPPMTYCSAWRSYDICRLIRESGPASPQQELSP